MKRQYIGDVNDFKKYGFLRILENAGFGSILVAWMLTENDDSPDGGKRGYLEWGNSKRIEKYRSCDPELFDALQKINGDSRAEPTNNQATYPAEQNPSKGDPLHHLQALPLFTHIQFFADQVPESSEERIHVWFSALLEAAKPCSLVFFDPDNGMETASTRMGKKNAGKYVYWSEIEAIWNHGTSVLIYQHFPRKQRKPFIQEKAHELSMHTHGSTVAAYRTPHFFFLLAVHEAQISLLPGVALSLRPWGNELFQELAPKAIPGVPMMTTIETSGSGSVFRLPDMIMVSATISVLRKEYAIALSDLIAAEKKLKEHAAGAGILSEAILSSHVRVSEDTRRDKTTDEYYRAGWRAQQSVSLSRPYSIEEMKNLAGVFFIQDNDLSCTISFDLADRKEPEREALGNAVNDARLRANALALAAGLHIARIRSIAPERSATFRFPDRLESASLMAPTILHGAEELSVNPGTIEISTSVTMIFEAEA